jgi:hypothetical protein
VAQSANDNNRIDLRSDAGTFNSDAPEEAFASEEEEAIPQPKRKPINTEALLLFGLLAAVGGGTYLMILRAGAQAGAMNPNAANAATTINGFLSGGVQNLRQTIAMVHDTEKVVANFNAQPAAHQVPVSGLQTNPFQSNNLKVEIAAPLSDDAAKREADEERQDATTIANGLKLESIIYGPHSLCMINGKSYAQGQGTSSFTVEKILPSGVLVRIGTFTTEIKMLPPRIN